MNIETRWRKTKAWLRRNFPGEYPATVRRIPAKQIYDGEPLDGCCSLGNDERFHIQINRNKSFALQLDALLHEWAHTLTWFTPGEEDHTAEWGVAYARLYRNFWAWNYGRSIRIAEED